jgi:hypothetical protein
MQGSKERLSFFNIRDTAGLVERAWRLSAVLSLPDLIYTTLPIELKIAMAKQ